MAGDPGAENEICRRYLPRLRRWARGRLPAAARPSLETEDIVQEVLIRAIRTFPGFELRHEHAFPAYLRTILANRLLDVARSVQRRPIPGPLDPEAVGASREPSPFDHVVDVEQHELMDAGMKQLGEGDQTLIFLRTELDYGYEEIVEMLRKSNPNAVRVATRRALVRLGLAIGKLQKPPG